MDEENSKAQVQEMSFDGQSASGMGSKMTHQSGQSRGPIPVSPQAVLGKLVGKEWDSTT